MLANYLILTILLLSVFKNNWDYQIIHPRQLLAITLALFSIFLAYFKRFLFSSLMLLVAYPILQTFSNLDPQIIYPSGMGFTILPYTFLTIALIDKGVLRMSIIFFQIMILFTNFYLEGIVHDVGTFFNIISSYSATIVGAIYVFDHISKDSAKLKEQKNELVKQNQELITLVKQVESRTELLTILSHDLKGPVIAFNKLSDKVNYLIKTNQVKRLAELALHFEESGKKLFNNIDLLLNWAASQRSDIKPNVTEFNLSNTIHEAVMSFYAVYNERLVINDHEDLELLIVHNDPYIITIILRNLIENAFKYGPDNTPVYVNTEQKDKMIIIEIKDLGEGIPETTLRKIDEGANFKSSHGHGVGLNLCTDLANKIGGELYFDKLEDPVGFTASLTFPILNKIV